MKILVADDDKNFRRVLATELSDEGFEVGEADSGLKAIDLLEKHEYDVSILDMNMPGLNGMDVLKQVKASDTATEVIILTGHATVSTAIEAMKLGAYDFLTKPFNVEELIELVRKAYEKKELLSENVHLKAQIKRQAGEQKIVTQDPAMFEILESVKKFASSHLPVLISGESGVGKELIARAIHDASKKSDGPFIPINCGAIPENTLESELFGHEKGSFTGAYARKPGLLEVANHGTLFFDEISELTTTLQGKLLRVVETGRFFRVGGVKEIAVDVKFLSATNKDIKGEVEKNNFRADLYYRISTLTVHIPPLRARRGDIPLLIEHIIRSTPSFKNKRFTKEALRVLSGYAWPGNVRELQNIVQRTLLLSRKDTINPGDLPGDLVMERRTSVNRLEDAEREHILRVLKEAGGQRGKAAEILGVDPKTLYRKLVSYGVTE